MALQACQSKSRESITKTTFGISLSFAHRTEMRCAHIFTAQPLKLACTIPYHYIGSPV